MDKTAIDRIVELSAPNMVEKYGFEYTDKPLHIVNMPAVETLTFKTLNGVVEAIKSECDNFVTPILVQIYSHNIVLVHGGIGISDRNREMPYKSEAELPKVDFDRQMDYESMMITLKSKFVETEELLDVVRLLGIITEENTNQIADDGFTQTVTVRKGIALRGNQIIRPIVRLRPYRTFLEVEQPESEFLLRLHDGSRVSLYEADGGAWKLQARKNIADYLMSSLSELVSGKVVKIIE